MYYVSLIYSSKKISQKPIANYQCWQLQIYLLLLAHHPDDRKQLMVFISDYYSGLLKILIINILKNYIKKYLLYVILCTNFYIFSNSIIKLLAEQKATFQEVQKSMSQMKHDIKSVKKLNTKIQKEETVKLDLNLPIVNEEQLTENEELLKIQENAKAFVSLT